MKVIAVILAIVAVSALGAHISEEEALFEFSKFTTRFNKTYASATEMKARFDIFRVNLDTIITHNEGKHSWTMGVNEFCDLTLAEFKATHFGADRPLLESLPSTTFSLHNRVTLPDSVDWREKGVVTPVKNQGSCGSCWAFSVTGVVEGAVAIKTGQLNSLSEQQLVDCSQPFGPQGCNGGWPSDALKYIISNKGLCTEADYPYKGTGGSCQEKSCTPVDSITSVVTVPANDELSLKAAAAQNPVSVCLDATSFMMYSGGVFDSSCGTQLDHAVLVVGYGTDAGKDFWLVKNSWGASWGEQGYIRLLRHETKGTMGQCGIAQVPVYPIAA